MPVNTNIMAVAMIIVGVSAKNNHDHNTANSGIK
jgi:hypothetical protein